MKPHVTIPFFIPHLGCVHECSFCNQRTISGRLHPPDPASIIPEILRLRSNVKNDARIEAAFFGGSFTAIESAIQDAYLEQTHQAFKQGLIDGIRISTRPDAISDEVCRRLSAYNVSAVELGAQSFDDDVLKIAQRGHTSADTIQSIKLLKEQGFETVLQLLPGLPGESFASALRSAKEAASLAPNAVRIYPAVVLEGTKLAALYTSGDYTPLTLDEAVERCSAMTEIFSTRTIPVIKTGIHPLSDTASDALIAGPYHPAFGFLVRARMKRNELAEKLRIYINVNSGAAHVRLAIPRLRAEEYIGHKRENISWLESAFAVHIIYSIDEVSTCPTFFTG